MSESKLYPPFSSAQQPISDSCKAAPSAELPGQPRIKLGNHDRLMQFLIQDLDLNDLESMAPYLWMMSTHKHTNVSALHRQLVKGRRIVVTEDHRLHLVWFYDRIFIKPLPRYLLSASFWEQYLLSSTSPIGDVGQLNKIRRAAAGLLRSYAFLIRYESDFHIARQNGLRLIPAEATWERLSEFLELVGEIPDSRVAERYQYGEIRLSRLNFYAKFILGKMAFQRVYGQYGAYFAQYYGPLLFVFAMLSVLLEALQVELQAEPLFISAEQWKGMWQLGRGFSVIVFICTVTIIAWLAGLLVYKIYKEWAHALSDRRARQRAEQVGKDPA